VSIRTVLVVLLALIFGGSAAIGINNYVMQRNQEPVAAPVPPPVETVPVVVAAVEIQRGKTVTPDLLTTKDYPKDLVPTGAVTNVKDALERTVAIPLCKDEPILDAKLASRSAGRGLAALVHDGMRLVTITTTVASAHAGLLAPGNRVDVLLTITSNSGGNNDPTGGGSTTALLQNVEILAVDHYIDAPADNKADANIRTVSLEVTPDQANMVELGQKKGQLTLSLRGTGDNKPAKTKTATVAGIQFHQEEPWVDQIKEIIDAASAATKKAPEKKPEPEPPAAPPPATVRTIRGTAEGSVEINQAESSRNGASSGRQGSSDEGRSK